LRTTRRDEGRGALVRACHAGGRGFESRPSPQICCLWLLDPAKAGMNKLLRFSGAYEISMAVAAIVPKIVRGFIRVPVRAWGLMVPDTLRVVSIHSLDLGMLTLSVEGEPGNLAGGA
jgi:hypothetical protein